MYSNIFLPVNVMVYAEKNHLTNDKLILLYSM